MRDDLSLLTTALNMNIEVAPYDPHWPELFANESQLIQDCLAPSIAAIHHIGSTSVAGLAAKPIIDILLDVPSLTALDAASPRLESLGYEAMGEFGIPRRRYFRKGIARRTHQVHAFASGDSHLQRHLAFRDYLRAHPAIAAGYAKLKLALAASCSSMDDYCEGKDPFIKHHEALALRWAAQA